MGAQNRCSGPRPAICGQSIDQRIIGRVGIARRGDAMAGHRWWWSCRADTLAEPRRLVAACRRLGVAANESDATGVPIARIGSWAWGSSPVLTQAVAVCSSRRSVMFHHSQQGRCGLVNFSAHSPQTCRPVSEHGTGQAADLQRAGPPPSQRNGQRYYAPLPFRHQDGTHTVSALRVLGGRSRVRTWVG